MKSLHLDFRHNYDLFGDHTYEQFHWGKLYLSMFNCYFSITRYTENFDILSYSAEIRQKYNVLDDSVIRWESSNIRGMKPDHIEYFLILRDGFCVVISDEEVAVFYNSDVNKKEVNDILEMGSQFVIETTSPKSIHMIKYEYDELRLERFSIRPCDIDIKSHYNEDFLKVHNRIKDKLTDGKNGIILLHGNYGTGKTFYIRHLINTIDRKFVFFPINMVESLSSPGLMPFLAKHPDLVLILEDCESLIMKREEERCQSSALSNLLNLGDGLLADALKINVICTFNSKLTKIDEALLRNGRLIAKYEFKELEIDKAQDLAIDLGISKIIKHPITVADIYNLREKLDVVPF